MIRISTSPPSNHDFPETDGSYYCDLHNLESWKEIDIIFSDETLRVFPGHENIKQAIIVAEYLFDARYKEIGVLLAFMNEEQELMYYGVDWQGNGRIEPAVNEAAWHIANAGHSLPEDYRLQRRQIGR